MTTSTDTGRRTRLEADDRREQIVAAAQALFAQHPYETVSTGDIAAAAGTTRTNIHHHFGTKRDLFLEIVERFSRLPLNLELSGHEKSVEEKVDHVLGRWLDMIEENVEVFMTMLHASSAKDPHVSGVLLSSMKGWESRLTVIVGMNPAAPADRAMVRSFQSMVTTATAEWLEAGSLTKEQVHHLLTHTLVTFAELTS